VKLYFIGGASGSGKTAVIAHLKELLGDDLAVYDFDDVGVPEGADKKWRQESTEKWLQKLLNEGKDACLLGQIVLGETRACPFAKNLDGINFCLLDVSDFERIQRLKKRNIYGADQNMLNWSAWFRMHTRDPQWTQHVIKDDSWDGLDFSSWDQNANWPNNVTTKIIDTTYLDIKEVAKQVDAWINGNFNEDKGTYKYCPRCKHVVISKLIDGFNRLACTFSECDFVFWNSPTPVVAGIIETEQGVVLAKNSAWKDDVYSIITGFINLNESPISAIKRECMEELGLAASNANLVGIYPFGERNQIIMVYHVEARGDIALNDELHSFKLFSRQELQKWPFGQEKLDGWPFGCGWAIRDWLEQKR
jgi:ADP-ribose pyrophosphatase YjhB (NUDIX family)